MAVVLMPEPDPRPDPYRISVKQYHAMIRAGVFGDIAPAELIRGLLLVTKQKTPAWCATRFRLRERLREIVRRPWGIDDIGAVTLADSEPEPQMLIGREEALWLPDRCPRAEEVCFVAEISHSTLAFDRGEKKAIYAEARIPVYWILNLIENQIEAYTEPAGLDYATRHDYRPGDEVPVVLMGTEAGCIRVAELLAPAGGITA